MPAGRPGRPPTRPRRTPRRSGGPLVPCRPPTTETNGALPRARSGRTGSVSHAARSRPAGGSPRGCLPQLLHDLGEGGLGRANLRLGEGAERLGADVQEVEEVLLRGVHVEEARQELLLVVRLAQEVEGGGLVRGVEVEAEL